MKSDSELNISIFRCPIIVDKSRAHRLGVLFEFLKDNCTLWILGDGSNKLQFVSASDLFIAIEKSLNLKGKYDNEYFLDEHFLMFYLKKILCQVLLN